MLLQLDKRRILGVFFRYFYVLRKGGFQLSDLFYWPLVDILLWGLTSVWIQGTGGDANLPLFLMTGLIFWQIVWRGSIDISINLLTEFWQRNLMNLFSTPVKVGEWIGGVLLLGLIKLALCICFGSLAVYFLYSLNVYSVGWMFVPFAVLLLIFGWTVGFISSSAIIYWGHLVESFAFMVGFVFAPFSAVFYPVAILPGWAQKIAWCLPTTYIFEGMRSILQQGHFPVRYFFTSLGLSVVYLAASIALFFFSFRMSKKKGLARLI